ncbi:peptide-methionine (S)-S-oxide reductase MsrA [Psychromonas antarctica]|uniref:peptide-methionine (S)-S-oxide reductase MsrA n=1 Tax=Psychromonas antarctica TaxID=67573 RepID=UPI001EE86A51|nr:peptide-methionine (S)-S-oxide reductase MsrA [Psychromonas antarctica]MCG6200791.1 peptide-methionine (S)-S-oxide reductase MsrA [Psychromonas antarctica]
MTISTATFAGGCFWCLEAAFNSLNGVKNALSGYTGGFTDAPSYEDICTGTSGHAEAVQIEFDDQQISYQALLNLFFSLHNPTQLNRQGHDIGSQYRSAIFYHNQQQKKQAEDFIEQLTDAKVYSDTIKTTLDNLTVFYPAEDYHQGYYVKNPAQGYCAMVITPKMIKFKEQYQAQLKSSVS